MDYLIAFADETDASKVAHDLLPFFEAVIKEVARHVPEKGYTSKTQSIGKCWLRWPVNEPMIT